MMGQAPDLCESFHHGLIVSCQAREGEPFRDPASLAQFAISAVAGGARAIRANGPENVRAIRQAVRVPLVGIWKRAQEDGKLLITPTFECAADLVAAGADMIALDVTRRGQRYGALERVRRIRECLQIPVLADIATLEEAEAAAAAGADFVLSTMRGYTEETASINCFDIAFVRELVCRSPVPVIAEGRIDTPAKAGEALAAGVYAVVVGSAITRPVSIARRFSEAVRAAHSGEPTA